MDPSWHNAAKFVEIARAIWEVLCYELFQTGLFLICISACIKSLSSYPL